MCEFSIPTAELFGMPMMSYFACMRARIWAVGYNSTRGKMENNNLKKATTFGVILLILCLTHFCLKKNSQKDLEFTNCKADCNDSYIVMDGVCNCLPSGSNKISGRITK